jgi:protoheme IX farnesyltransferase
MFYSCRAMHQQPETVGSVAAGAATPPFPRLRDLVELGKPRLSSMVIFTAAVGVWLAGGPFAHWTTLVFLLSTSCLVAAANTLNCWIEAEIDGLMIRTRTRPLPAGRMEPRVALASGLLLSTVSLGALSAVTNTLTTLLGAIALVSYVLIYTPLKRVSPWALYVGAVPGAIPPLMGWTAASGELGTPGLFLFAILFAWQLPHFLAISLNLKEDFRRGGIRVLPLVSGDLVARRYLFAYTVLMGIVAVAGQPLGVAGYAYSTVALALSVAFIVIAAPGLRREAPEGWSRRVFLFTLLHLPVLISVLVINAR